MLSRIGKFVVYMFSGLGLCDGSAGTVITHMCLVCCGVWSRVLVFVIDTS